MSRCHLVRVGAVGSVGRFVAVDAAAYPRGCRVIVRTARGLELGEVLAPTAMPTERGQTDGSILRRVTVEDDLLAARLEQHRQEALEACSARLVELGLLAALVDAEMLFDGRTVYFYFLGEVTPELERVTDQLAATYDAVAGVSRFAQTLVEGCGPGCGTDAAAGCATCVTGCAVSAACVSRGQTAS
jgi:hypothetical protein